MGSKLPSEKCTLVPDQNGENKPREVMSSLKSMSAGVGVCGWFTIPDQREKSGLPSDYFLNPGEGCEEDFQEALFQGPWNTPRKRSRDVCLN